MSAAREISILIGGKAGFGIDKAGILIGSALNRTGFRIYIYREYPSIIRGGHTFSLIRASEKKVFTHRGKIDYLVALNQETVDIHKLRVKDGSVVLYDSGSVKSPGIGIDLNSILKEEAAPEIMKNTCIVGALLKLIGIEWSVVEGAVKNAFTKDTELNIKMAKRGYDAVTGQSKSITSTNSPLPLITGSEAIGLGLLKGGLGAYLAYPMTPSSPVLHFLANEAQKFSIKVLHPENEVAVMLMALGFSYCGQRVAVGTSGGGFCLMTEGVSFSGMAELPVVVILGQRPGPSTGLPTYSSQTELFFALYAGQGEFLKCLIAPGDAEEAYAWSCTALDIASKFQIPVILLTDKNVGEGTYSFDVDSSRPVERLHAPTWDGKGEYKRYLDTQDGISPIAFPSMKDAIIKINSYEHDESGVTTEDPVVTRKMQDKRMRKEKALLSDLENLSPVGVYGKKDAKCALLCWGSNKGVCIEAATKFDLKVIQPIVLWPFPYLSIKNALSGVEKIIAVENNATSQLAELCAKFGIKADRSILKYNGRPFALEELELKIGEAL